VSEEPNGSTDLMNLGEARVLTAADVLRHAKLIEEVKSAVMKPDSHYGLIPGCGPKPALLKPGAEKLLLTFGLSTQHDIQQRDLGGGHREYEIRTIVKSGQRIIAEGVGVCSTMEKKYRWRDAPRKCPKCGKAGSIIKGKAEYGGGWLCWKKKEGCDSKFKDGDASIEGQAAGQVENPDLADTYNTVLKMAKKRSLVDGALTSTASSDFFAQDLEDLEVKDAQFVVQEAAAAAAAPPPAAESTPPPRRRASAPKASQAPQDVEFLGGKGASETGAMLEGMMQGPSETASAPKPPEPPADAPAAPAASNGALRSMRGLTLEEWKLLTEEQRAASKDVTRKQCVLISSLAKSKGINDLALIMGELRNDFTREFDEFGIKELWQVDSRIASYAIDQLKATPF